MQRRDFTKLLLASGATGAAGQLGLFGDGLAYAQSGSGGLTAIIQPEPPLLILPLNQQIPVGVVGGKIYESLLSYDFDLSPQPQLAESWDVSEDGLTYTFKLEEGVTFHDGTAFDSADVLFSFNRALAEDSVNPSKGYFKPIASVAASPASDSPSPSSAFRDSAMRPCGSTFFTTTVISSPTCTTTSRSTCTWTLKRQRSRSKLS